MSAEPGWKGPLSINLASGLFYGYAIGFVAIYMAFNTFNTDCYKMQSQGACSTLEHAHCVWFDPVATMSAADSMTSSFTSAMEHHHHVDSTSSSEDAARNSIQEASLSGSGLTHAPAHRGARCLYTDHATVHCQVHDGNEKQCADTTGCTYDYAKKTCDHNPDWSAVQSGIFAGALIAGCMGGSLIFGKVSDAIGRKKGLLIVGIIGLVACAMQTGARLAGSYALLIIARVVLGFSAGSACIVTPTYVEEMTPILMRSTVGSFFQIAITGGIAVAAVLGYALEPRDWSADNLHMETRIQVMMGGQWLLCSMQLLISCWLPESTAWMKKVDDEVNNLLNVDQMAKQGPRASLLSNNSQRRGGSFPVKKLAVPLVGGFFLALSLQLTGINAVMNYAPQITKAAKLSPLLGNMVIMMWNFVTTLAAIPLSKKFEQRTIYLTFTMAASLSCLLTGIPIFPGVVSDQTTKSALVGIGVVMFVGFFEMGMGPPFYILGQRLFPVEHRATGMSFVMFNQFIANIIINVGFPIAVVGLSGGPSANQDKGIAITFILFGSIGLVCWVVMNKTLFDFEKEKKLFESDPDYESVE